MIDINKFELENGLKVIVHENKISPIAAFNLLYDVGARDESPERTGFAHLFEHLMFGGSKNIPNYDTALQKAGGNNNAFTSNDITNYYITLPTTNIETAFWLESDRMLELAFTDKSLETQRNVVCEEFRQRYLNQPYGDVWLLFRPLVYKVHPYRWATIGKKLEHIEQATMQEVKNFYFSHYAPNNAILSIVGDVETQEMKELAERWFGGIKRRTINERKIKKEPIQKEMRRLTVERDVPSSALFLAFHAVDRLHEDYHTVDIISDILATGRSSRLYEKLVMTEKLFSGINAFITGTIDQGLIIVAGYLNDNVELEQAEKAVWAELKKLSNEEINQKELDKAINKVESDIVFSEIKNLTKAMNLSYFELIGDANKINCELDNYRQITTKKIKEVSQRILTENNCSVLYYKAK